MIEEIKILREFLCDHNASSDVHLALDVIVHHLRMLPEERSKRDFVTGDWVRIVGPEPQSVVARILGFREDFRILLDGLTGSFEAHQLEHWFPHHGDAVWVKNDRKAGTLVMPIARGTDYCVVMDRRNNSDGYSLQELEPYVGQDGK